MPCKKSGLFGKLTEVPNREMWDYLGTSLQRHAGKIDLVIAGGDQCHTDGVPTLDIWRYLNHRVRREGEELLPDEESMLSWYRDIYRGYWGFLSMREVFYSLPTYLIWDDHEIGGLGLPLPRRRLAQDAPCPAGEGPDRRRRARACRAHALDGQEGVRGLRGQPHPPTEEGVLDYSFRRGSCAY